MKLHYAPTSPFVRKVMVLLHETGNLDAVELLSVHTTPIDPSATVRASNPLAKIPALERSEGPALYDSRVICAYLDAHFGSGLYGQDEDLWSVRTLEATADGIMDAAVLMTYERRLRPAALQSEDWFKAQLGKVLGACEALNARWIGHLRGPLNIGQIAVACALAYVDFRHPDAGWRTGNTALADWFAEFESRPSMVQTRPPKA